VNTDQRAKAVEKDGARTPLESLRDFHFSHSFNNNLGKSIRQRRFAPATDHIDPGTLITISPES
jgi:hypothetical protein